MYLMWFLAFKLDLIVKIIVFLEVLNRPFSLILLRRMKKIEDVRVKK